MTIKEVLLQHYNGHAIVGKLLICEPQPVGGLSGQKGDMYLVQIQVKDDFLPGLVESVGDPLEVGAEVRFSVSEGDDFVTAESRTVLENPVQAEVLAEDIPDAAAEQLPEEIPAAEVKAKRGRPKKAKQDATDTVNQEQAS